MKKVLIVVHTKIFFPRMLEFGKLLADSPAYQPIFHFAHKNGWDQIDEQFRILEDQNYKISVATRLFVTQQSEKAETGAIPQTRNFSIAKLRSRFKEAVRLTPFASLYGYINRFLNANFFSHFFKIRHRLIQIREILQKEQIDLVVISDDVPTWDTGVFVKASHLAGVPAVVSISQTGPCEEASHVCSKRADLSTKLPHNFFLAKLYPKWLNQYDGKRFIMMPFGQTLAKELLDVTMPQPWIESSSNADAVLIEGEAYLARGLKAGLNADNLFVTGTPYHDILHTGLSKIREAKNKIYTLHDLPFGKPIILTSLLPCYEGRDNAGPEFSNYWEMVDFWFESLLNYTAYYTILSLHPSQEPSDFWHLEDSGVTIARMPVTEIMPVCHAYVASLSSTITMALSCGKPVVNYDYARYGNTHYDNAPGMIRVETKTDFQNILGDLLDNPDYYNSVVSAQSNDAWLWGNIDGKAGQRIMKLFDKLSNAD